MQEKLATSNPDHSGNTDFGYPPPSSPFRPSMQSPGPSYQSTMGPAMNYPEHPYENQMASHCQTAGYPTYQSSSPYRPHPVSPPAHAHQYNSPAAHQMHSGVPYGATPQMSLYGVAQSPYGHMGQDMYSSRHSLYSSSSTRSMQQAKSAWGDSGTGSDIMQSYGRPTKSAWGDSSTGPEIMQSYSRPTKSAWGDASTGPDIMQPYSRPASQPPVMTTPPHMPPPPMRSSPHATINSTGPPLPPPHFRQIHVGSSSPSSHPWHQSQIPSPGVLPSPRTTPSPLPAHSRSPGHGQPFSPPPAAPSPHHAATHPQPQKSTPSPPIVVCSTPNQQPLCNSPNSQGVSSDPLQSLQKMVMLDNDSVGSPISRASYDMANSQPTTPVTSRSGSYFSSVEQLAGCEPGSPFPTYYNLDQNRLSTPPHLVGSTATTSPYRQGSEATSPGARRPPIGNLNQDDSSSGAHINGDSQSTSSDGSHPPGRLSCGSLNGSQQYDPQHQGFVDCETTDLLEHKGDSSLNRKENGFSATEATFTTEDQHFENRECSKGIDSDSVTLGPQDDVNEKPLELSHGRKNMTFRESEFANGELEVSVDNLKQSSFLATCPRWNKTVDTYNCLPRGRGHFHGSGVGIGLQLKRSPRRRRSASGSLVNVISHYESDAIQNSPRRSPGRGRGRGRRRKCSGGGTIDNFTNDNQYGYYQNSFIHDDNRHLEPWHAISEQNGPISVHQPIKAGFFPGTSPAPSDSRGVQNSTAQIFSNNTPSPHLSVTPGALLPLGNSLQFPPKKKRGRPFGSKNKPKPPGMETKRKPGRKKKTEVLQSEAEQVSRGYKRRYFNGPYIHIDGTKEMPLSISIVNIPPKEDIKEVKNVKQRRQVLDSNIRKKLLVHISALSPMYDATTKDKTWVCALCQRGSHSRGLGDLFGPYYINEDQRPSSEEVPSVKPFSVIAEACETDHEEELELALTGRIEGKPKPEEEKEEFLRANISKKIKQCKKPCNVSETREDSELSQPDPVHTPSEEEVERKEFWVHEDCAVWSHGVYLMGQKIHGLAGAIEEASETVCSLCQMVGATIGCLNKGCPEQYHYICATETGCELDEGNYSLFCPKHKNKTEMPGES
ncbi:uncharacterized protein LOC143239599 isoform X1 [Tachypleus tridentatus]|uniref:uncharacterized protein LOC143239599 isoform X1 n=1 Tax=Tachypleus tridentatus TaxID=6853 RepID=UPI003FCF6759